MGWPNYIGIIMLVSLFVIAASHICIISTWEAVKFVFGVIVFMFAISVSVALINH